MFYHNLATRMGLKNGCRVEHIDLRQRLLQDWEHTEFKTYFASNDWLINIFRKHRRSFHPLRHLLVWCSLIPNKSIKEIISDIDRQPKDKPKGVEKSSFTCAPLKGSTQMKRELWLQLLNQQPNQGIKQIRSSSPGGAVYAWLYRNDQLWFMKNRPSKIKKADVTRKTDYTSWDQNNVSILKSFKFSVLDNASRQRLSQSFLIKQLPRASSVEKHLKDLPRTKDWLAKNTESVEDFQSYRIKKSAELLHSQFKPLKKWRLLRLAGIRSEKITPALELLIRSLETKGGVF
jgi:hypothetical protein